MTINDIFIHPPALAFLFKHQTPVKRSNHQSPMTRPTGTDTKWFLLCFISLLIPLLSLTSENRSDGVPQPMTINDN
jgi:hypothetical protein